MTELNYRHDRAGDTSALRVTLRAHAAHGALGPQGVGAATGLPVGSIDAQGWLKNAAGDGPYRLTVPREGYDPEAPEYTLTVEKNGRPISAVTFRPLLRDGEAAVDVNALLRAGRAVSASPEQLRSLGEGLDELGTLLPEARQTLANTAQSAAQATAAAGLTPAPTLASITTDGLYRVMGGAEAGQVYRRTGGVLTRERGLEVAPAAADHARRNLARADLAAKGEADGPQFADGSRWLYRTPAQATLDNLLPNGGPDLGTIVPATGGGVWQREETGGLNVRWFGAKGDGVADDTDAIHRAQVFAYSRAVQEGWRVVPHGIYLPGGKYRVAQPNVLFKDCPAASFHLRGDGRWQTEIIYDVPNATADQSLINNNNLFGFSTFEHLRFRSANATGVQRCFNYHSTGTAQHLTFINCEFVENWDDLFDVNGPYQASENSFINCKFGFFRGAAFIFNNPQAVNFRFFGCEFEGFSGTAFRFLQGTTVYIYQGSIIPTAGTAKIIEVPEGADANTFGATNSPSVVINAARIELREGAKFVDKRAGNVGFSIVCEQGGMGGYNIINPALTPAIHWVGAGQMRFRGVRNMQGYRMDWSGQGISAANALNIILDDVDVDRSFLTLSTFTLTNGDYLHAAYPHFSVRNCSPELDGDYRMGRSEGRGYDNRSIVKQMHAVSFGLGDDQFAYGAKGAQFARILPPSRLLKIEWYPIQVFNYGAAQLRIKIKTKNGAEYHTFAWQADNPPVEPMVKYMNYDVDLVNNDRIVFELDGPDGDIGIKGYMYLTY